MWLTDPTSRQLLAAERAAGLRGAARPRRRPAVLPALRRRPPRRGPRAAALGAA